MKFKLGDVIRYAFGSTALMRVDSIEHGNKRYYGKHCLGGLHGCNDADAVAATEGDLAEWRTNAHWRGEDPVARRKPVELSFTTLRAANSVRLPTFKNKQGDRAHSSDDGSDWKLTEWVNATAGELGEYADLVLLAAMTRSLGLAANNAKKVIRGDVGLDDMRQAIANELADIVTYVDIVARRCDIDLGEAVVNKFNEVSRRVRSPVLIKPDGSTHYLENC